MLAEEQRNTYLEKIWEWAVLPQIRLGEETLRSGHLLSSSISTRPRNVRWRHRLVRLELIWVRVIKNWFSGLVHRCELLYGFHLERDATLSVKPDERCTVPQINRILFVNNLLGTDHARAGVVRATARSRERRPGNKSWSHVDHCAELHYGGMWRVQGKGKEDAEGQGDAQQLYERYLS